MVHLDSVFRLAMRLTRNGAEAEDLVQETMVRAFRAFPRFEMRDHGAKPWLFKILHNVFYTHGARAGRRPALLDDAGLDRLTAADDPGADAMGADDIDWDSIDGELKRAVESLRPEFRVVLLLWSFEQMSYQEIADVCGCPVGTVMSRLFRARQLLMEKLRDYAKRENIPLASDTPTPGAGDAQRRAATGAEGNE